MASDAWARARRVDDDRYAMAVRRLAGDTRKAVWHLSILAHCWGRVACRVPIGIQLAPREPSATDVNAAARWIESNDVHIRRAAFSALSHVRTCDTAVSSAVARHLTDDDPIVRMLAARGLMRFATAAEHPQLATATNDPLFTVRWYAAAALHRLGDHDAAANALLASPPRAPKSAPDNLDFDRHFREWFRIVTRVVESSRDSRSLTTFRESIARIGAMTAARERAFVSASAGRT